jgi:acyl-CoA-binding protein
MNTNDIDLQFQKAVESAAAMTQASLPQDVQLRLYAYYKQSTLGTVEIRQTTSYHLRDAFKTNAWMQISHITATEAKQEYIAIINSILKNNEKNEK